MDEQKHRGGGIRYRIQVPDCSSRWTDEELDTWTEGTVDKWMERQTDRRTGCSGVNAVWSVSSPGVSWRKCVNRRIAVGVCDTFRRVSLVTRSNDLKAAV